ncbi:MAG: hypothetical protein ABIH28_01085 [archaeon]
MKSKRAMQLPFAWIFASLVGAVILFLSIHIAVKLINTGETEIDLKTGKSIGILLSPLEIAFESAQTTLLVLPVETRIYGECANTGNFGEQRIKISQLSFKEWTDTNLRVSFQNKYIFSKNYSEGKNFYIFSKPFEMPFKIADLIYLSSSKEKYCFVDSPENIKEELESLGQGNIETKNCSQDSMKVCFSLGSSCEIGVDYSMGVVAKKSDRLYFEGDALMYAAIFSDAAVYECQVKRLMQRVEQLSLLYRDKDALVSQKECNSNLNLVSLATLARNLEDSRELNVINNIAKEIKIENEYADCRLW